MQYLGDFLEDATIPFLWPTNDAAGGSVTRATDGTVKVERDDGTDCTGTSITDSEDDPDTGLHRGSCDSSDNANFAANHFYYIWVDGSGIDGETVNGYIACFSIEYAGLNKQVDVTKWLGTACSTPTTAGLPEVDVIHWDGTAVDGPDTAGVPNVNLVGIDGAKTDGMPAVASRPILYLQQFNLHCSLSGEGAMHAENDAGGGYGIHAGGAFGQHNYGTSYGTYNKATSGYGQRNEGSSAGLYNTATGNGHGQRNERAGSGKDVYLAGSGSIENAVGDILANLDAAISSRNSVTPDAAGVVATLLSALETHGDGAWATATGFALASAWTAARAAYLDNLNVGGNVASQADVQGITQACRVRVCCSPQWERPDSGSTTYRIWVYAYDEQHKAEDLDASATITVENNAGTDRSANLGAVTHDGTGIYYADYTVASDHAIEGLTIKVAATEGAVTTNYVGSSSVTDTTAVDFTAADRTKLDAINTIAGQLPDGGSLDDLATILGIVQSGTHGNAALKTLLDSVYSSTSSIQNNTRVVRAVPARMEIPASSSTVYRLELLLYDTDGNMEAPDAAPTVAVVNQSGTDRSANLDAGTMTLVSAGRYRSTYTVASDHATEELVFTFSVVEGGATRLYSNAATVGDVEVATVTLAANGLDGITIETGTDGNDDVNGRQALCIMLAAAFGQISGCEDNAPVITGGNAPSTNRIEATTDRHGNRTSVTGTLPS